MGVSFCWGRDVLSPLTEALSPQKARKNTEREERFFNHRGHSAENRNQIRNATFPGGRGSCRSEEGSNDFPTARQEPRPPVGFSAWGSAPGETCTKNKKWPDSSTEITEKERERRLEFEKTSSSFLPLYYYPAISCFLCTLFMQPFP